MNFANLFRQEEDLIELEDGYEVIRAGEPSSLFYVVVDGAVDIKVGENMVETVREGGAFGEMSIVDNEPASATVVVNGNAKLAAVNEKRFLFLVQQHPTFALELMRLMSARLRKMDVEW